MKPVHSRTERLQLRLHVAKIGDTLHVYDKESLPIIQRRIKRALSNGELVIHEDKSREWISTVPIHDPDKDGSDSYIWDSSGDRIKCNRVRHLVQGDAHILETLRPVYRGWDAVFND